MCSMHWRDNKSKSFVDLKFRKPLLASMEIYGFLCLVGKLKHAFYTGQGRRVILLGYETLTTMKFMGSLVQRWTTWWRLVTLIEALTVLLYSYSAKAMIGVCCSQDTLCGRKMLMIYNDALAERSKCVTFWDDKCCVWLMLLQLVMHAWPVELLDWCEWLSVSMTERMNERVIGKVLSMMMQLFNFSFTFLESAEVFGCN